MTDHDDEDLDAALAAIEARETERKVRRHKVVNGEEDAMHKALNAAFARVDRAHRRASERHEIKSFEC